MFPLVKRIDYRFNMKPFRKRENSKREDLLLSNVDGECPFAVLEKKELLS